MKKILVVAAVVVVLIAFVKLGSGLLDMVISQDGTKTSEVIANGEPSSEDKIKIEIINETESKESEAAIAEGGMETESEPETKTAAGSGTLADADSQNQASVETTAQVNSVTPSNKTMYAAKSVNVRASYSTDSAVIAGLRVGQEVRVTGETRDGWVRIDHAGQPAYVYKTYLTTTKPEIETTSAVQKPTQAPTQAPEPKPTDQVTQPGSGPDSDMPPLIVPPPPF